MRMRLAFKKSQNTLDTSKGLHRIKTRSTGSAGKGFDSNFAMIGTADSETCRVITPWRILGGSEIHTQATYNRTVDCMRPQSKDS